MKALNLGCGQRYHLDWVNIDFQAHSESVTACNLSEGIPFPDNTFDVVYHSHLLEHFPKESASQFLSQCLRVLKPNGILRVAVPDLEAIAKNYLSALDKVISEVPEWNHNYDWIVLELLDQAVRNYSGGSMAVYLEQESLPNADFVIQRIGKTAQQIIFAGEQKRSQVNKEHPNLKTQIKTFIKPFYHFLRDPSHRREIFLQLLLGSEYEALQIGRFRQSGEVHQWMYDRYSLKRLLEHCGFSDVVQRSAVESYIENWHQFNLDTEPDGSVYKSDSLYMEAVKPEL